MCGVTHVVEMGSAITVKKENTPVAAFQSQDGEGYQEGNITKKEIPTRMDGDYPV